MRTGEFLGDRKGRNWDFYSKNPLAWGRFTGADLGRILGTFTSKDPSERGKIGET
jgi:hypothetical protein